MRALFALSLLVATPAFAGSAGTSTGTSAPADSGKVKGMVKAIDTAKQTLTLSVQKSDRSFSTKGLTLGADIVNGAHVVVTYAPGAPTVATGVTVITDKQAP